jgi:putative ABC transport system permease protein
MRDVLHLPDQATQILVRTSQSGQEDLYLNRLMEYGIQERIRTYQEKNQEILNQVVTSFSIINAISSGVSLVIAVVVIFIVVFINTINKRRQIGILKAIGINKRVIVYSYVIQVIILATCGTVIGLLMSVLLIYFLTIRPLVFPGGPVYPVVDLVSIIRSIISIYLVSLISGFIPSYNTANEPILEAIRGA